jgi:hypothetical protein
MKEHPINQQNNFIMGWYADDNSFVDDLIQYHNNSDDKQTGTFSPDVKESTDVSLPFEYPTKYWDVFRGCLDQYFEKYIGAKMNSGIFMKQCALIQHYPVGGGFKVWHAERSEEAEPNVSRHLVFMTYLNDVPDGGTEFMYQNVKVKAEKGLTLIWPADWCFTHRGEISHTMEKWVITGWINLKEKK